MKRVTVCEKETVEKFIEDKVATNAQVEEVKTRHSGYKSFHIVFTSTDFERDYLDPDGWPEGCYVRRWHSKEAPVAVQAVSNDANTED